METSYEKTNYAPGSNEAEKVNCKHESLQEKKAIKEESCFNHAFHPEKPSNLSRGSRTRCNKLYMKSVLKGGTCRAANSEHMMYDPSKKQRRPEDVDVCLKHPSSDSCLTKGYRDEATFDDVTLSTATKFWGEEKFPSELIWLNEAEKTLLNELRGHDDLSENIEERVRVYFLDGCPTHSAELLVSPPSQSTRDVSFALGKKRSISDSFNLSPTKRRRLELGDEAIAGKAFPHLLCTPLSVFFKALETDHTKLDSLYIKDFLSKLQNSGVKHLSIKNSVEYSSYEGGSNLSYCSRCKEPKLSDNDKVDIFRSYFDNNLSPESLYIESDNSTKMGNQCREESSAKWCQDEEVMEMCESPVYVLVEFEGSSRANALLRKVVCENVLENEGGPSYKENSGSPKRKRSSEKSDDASEPCRYLMQPAMVPTRGKRESCLWISPDQIASAVVAASLAHTLVEGEPLTPASIARHEDRVRRLKVSSIKLMFGFAPLKELCQECLYDLVRSYSDQKGSPRKGSSQGGINSRRRTTKTKPTWWVLTSAELSIDQSNEKGKEIYNENNTCFSWLRLHVQGRDLKKILYNYSRTSAELGPSPKKPGVKAETPTVESISPVEEQSLSPGGDEQLSHPTYPFGFLHDSGYDDDQSYDEEKEDEREAKWLAAAKETSLVASSLTDNSCKVGGEANSSLESDDTIASSASTTNDEKELDRSRSTERDCLQKKSQQVSEPSFDAFEISEKIDYEAYCLQEKSQQVSEPSFNAFEISEKIDYEAYRLQEKTQQVSEPSFNAFEISEKIDYEAHCLQKKSRQVLEPSFMMLEGSERTDYEPYPTMSYESLFIEHSDYFSNSRLEEKSKNEESERILNSATSPKQYCSESSSEVQTFKEDLCDIQRFIPSLGDDINSSCRSFRCESDIVFQHFCDDDRLYEYQEKGERPPSISGAPVPVMGYPWSNAVELHLPSDADAELVGTRWQPDATGLPLDGRTCIKSEKGEDPGHPSSFLYGTETRSSPCDSVVGGEAIDENFATPCVSSSLPVSSCTTPRA